jgi:O-antigen/teichoic acid export membrane protein
MMSKTNAPPSFRSLLKIESKDAFTYALTTFITKSGGFLIVPLLWKRLTPYDYGILATAEMIGVFVSTILGLSLDMNITRFYHEWGDDEKKRRIGNIWVVGWGSTLGFGFLALFLFPLVNPILFPDVSFFPYIFLGLIGTMLDALGVIPFATIRMKQQPRLYAQLRISSFVLQTSLNLFYVLVLNKGVLGIFISNIISSALVTLFYLFLMFRWARPNLNMSDLREALKFSIPLIPSQVLSNLVAITDRYLLQKFAGIESLGIYSVCMKFTNIISTLHGSLKMSYVPFAFRALSTHDQVGKTNLSRMVGFYIFPLFLTGTALAIFIGEFVHWVNRPAYFEVIPLIPYFVGVAILNSLSVYYSLGILMSKKTHLSIIPIVFQFLFTIASCVILIPRFHLPGLIASRYISAAVFFVVSVLVSSRVYPLINNWKVLIRFSVLCIGVILLRQLIGNVSLIAGIIIGTIMILTYGVGAMFSLGVPLNAIFRKAG